MSIRCKMEGDHYQESDLASSAQADSCAIVGLRGERFLLLGQLRVPDTPDYSETDSHAPTTPSRTGKSDFGADLT
jgi:hypothetical protein